MQEQSTVIGLPKRSHRTLWIIGTAVLIVILMAASAGGAYWWRDNRATSESKTQAATINSLTKDKQNLQKQIADLKAAAVASTTSTAQPTTCTPKAPDATTISNIEASITSGNTAALQGYMATTVQDVYAAADAIPAGTAAASVVDITTFVSDQITGVWSFPVSAGALTTYRAGSYGKYFPSVAVVGGSTRHRVISFSFDCNGKINTVFMAADDSVL